MTTPLLTDTDSSHLYALITGASSGIGRAYAEQLARSGYNLVLVARRADRLQALADELQQAQGTVAEVLPADLGTDAGVRAVTERIEQGNGIQGTPLALLINNAGYAVRGTVADLDPPSLDAMLRVNILALSQLSHSALRRMIAVGRGAIINVASGTVFMQMKGNAGYGASKNYVTAFTRHMQVETEGTGVEVQLLIPGLVATEFHAVAGNDMESFPPERVMSAEDLVRASLQALEQGERVCIPSLPDITDWENYVAAERVVAANVSRNKSALRYNTNG